MARDKSKDKNLKPIYQKVPSIGMPILDEDDMMAEVVGEASVEVTPTASVKSVETVRFRLIETNKIFLDMESHVAYCGEEVFEAVPTVSIREDLAETKELAVLRGKRLYRV